MMQSIIYHETTHHWLYQHGNTRLYVYFSVSSNNLPLVKTCQAGTPRKPEVTKSWDGPGWLSRFHLCNLSGYAAMMWCVELGMVLNHRVTLARSANRFWLVRGSSSSPFTQMICGFGWRWFFFKLQDLDKCCPDRHMWIYIYTNIYKYMHIFANI